MCIVRTPRVQSTPETKKDPIIIRSPYLDGLTPASKALRTGRDAVRIERGTSASAVPALGVAPSRFAGVPVATPQTMVAPQAIPGSRSRVTAGLGVPLR